MLSSNRLVRRLVGVLTPAFIPIRGVLRRNAIATELPQPVRRIQNGSYSIHYWRTSSASGSTVPVVRSNACRLPVAFNSVWATFSKEAPDGVSTSSSLSSGIKTNSALVDSETPDPRVSAQSCPFAGGFGRFGPRITLVIQAKLLYLVATCRRDAP